MKTVSLNTLTSILDLIALRDIFIFSNTPMYLYKHFRENISVRELAKQFSTVQLVKHFEYILKVKRKTLDMLVCIYSIIIALTFKDYYEAQDFFTKLDRYRFRWAKDLKCIYISLHRSTLIFKENLNKPKIIIREEAR